MVRIFAAIILFFSMSSQAAPVALLKDTQTFKKGSAFVAELTFNGPVEVNKTSVEYINQTVQLNIRGASVSKGKQHKKVVDEKVNSVFTYQIEPDLMRTRIIYKKPQKASQLEGYVHMTSKGNKLTVTIEDPSAVASKDVQKQLPVIPPVDLNAELEPKSTSAGEIEDLEASATALLEREFLKKTKEVAASGVEKSQPKKSEIKTEKSKSAVAATTDVDVAGKKESEIPLNLNESKVKKSDISPWNRMIISLIVISIVGIAMVVFARRYSKSNGAPGGNIKIKVISQQSIGPKKNLTVVRVAGEDILIGVTDYNISMIKSLSFIDDEIESDVPQNFVNELNRVTDEYVDNKVRARSGRATTPAPTATASHTADVEDDFSMGNIKDMISTKLKEMRPL